MMATCTGCGGEMEKDMMNEQGHCPVCAAKMGEKGVCMGCKMPGADLNEKGYCQMCAE